jgi:diguanylate cyclase (GGDEF)-like protein
MLHSLDTPTILKAGIMAQASITVTLLLLRVADRRARGMGWLTGTSALSVVAMALRLPHVRQLNLVWDVPVAVACSLGALCAYFGFRFLTHPRYSNSSAPDWRLWPALALIAIVSGLLLGPTHPFLALVVVRLTTMFILIVTIVMLCRTRDEVLWFTMRLAAGVYTLILLIPAGMVVLDLCGVDFYRNSLFSRIAVLVVITLVDFVFVATYVAESKRRLYNGIRRDVLTGLSNRLALEEAAARHTSPATHRSPLALLMLDLDSFKALNDTWGHIVGDRALRAVSEVLQSVTSNEQSCIARFGGEEFAVLLPGHDARAAAATAEHLRSAIEAIRLPVANGIVTVTASIGFSTLHGNEGDWTAMLHRADAALYQAKATGRNRAVSSASTEEIIAPRRVIPRPALAARIALKMTLRKIPLRKGPPTRTTATPTAPEPRS